MALADQQIDFPIIDSHIHLYAASHLKDLAWASTLPKDHVLSCQNSLDEYRAATKSCRNLLGFVFVETDRIAGLQDSEWDHAIEEVEFLTRIKSGTPIEGEGHTSTDKNLLLGIVAWAPVPASQASLETYLTRLNTTLSSCNQQTLLKGYRYLVQDKPLSTQLNPAFIQGLQTLEQSGPQTFDLGVDFRQGGHHQLLESIEMLHTLSSTSPSTSTLKIIINHLCKPNLHLTPQETPSHPDFTNWSTSIRTLASFKQTYLKLSGLFSELPSQPPDSPTPIADLVAHTKPWLDVVFAAFGPRRIMFGSDWPVCNVGGPGREKAWGHWVEFVGAVLEDQGLDSEGKGRVWAGTAVEGYGLDVDLGTALVGRVRG